jgi:hypothetical protein
MALQRFLVAVTAAALLAPAALARPAPAGPPIAQETVAAPPEFAVLNTPSKDSPGASDHAHPGIVLN